MDVQEFEVELQASIWYKGRLRRLLRNFGACNSGLKFVVGKDLQVAWGSCPNGRWMAWWIRKLSDRRDDGDAKRTLKIIERTLDKLYTRRVSHGEQSPTRYERAFAAAMRVNFNEYGKVR